MGIFDRFDNCPVDEDENIVPSSGPINESETTPSPVGSPTAGSGDRIVFDKPVESPKVSTPNPTTDHADKRTRRGCGFWFWFFFVIAIALGITIWIRYFNPYVTDAQIRGYIVNVEKRGIVFKTFEGELLSKTAMEDTNRIYSRDFTFSVANDSLARVIQSFSGTGRQVIINYRSYYGMLPWRGSSCNIADGIMPARPSADTDDSNNNY